MHLIKSDFLSIPIQSARIYTETGRHIELVSVMEERGSRSDKAFQSAGYTCTSTPIFTIVVSKVSSEIQATT
jgi:hypothetical protein